MTDLYDALENDSSNPILRSGSRNSTRVKSVSFKENRLELAFDNSENGPLIEAEGRLTIFRKLCFAVGGLPYQMCGNALALYIPIFLLEIAQIKPSQVSIILFSARGWDAITDPLIGFFVNRTNTRFGKLRPWILFSSPFAILSYMMIWYVPDIDRGTKTFWYLLFYCLFQTFLSCLHVPYTSLTMYLSPLQSERDSATGFRMAFEVFGVLLAAVIQGIIITIFGQTTSCDTSTLANLATMPNLISSNLSETTTTASLATSTKGQSNLSRMKEGYLLSAIIMSSIYLCSSFTVFFGTKEMKDVIQDKNFNFFSSLKSIFKHKSYLTLLFTFLFNSLAVQLVQSNLALYCKYSVDAKDQYQIIIIVLLMSSIVSLPLWQFSIPKYGKKSIYAFGLMLFIPNMFALLYIEKPVWVMYIIAICSGFSIAVNFLLPWSMLPDVIDEFMIKTGERKESIFYSFYVFFTKLSSGLAVSVSALILEFVGYQECQDGCCNQPESVGLALRLLVVPGPVIMILIALLFLWKHPIDEIRRKEIKETLTVLRSTTNRDS